MISHAVNGTLTAWRKWTGCTVRPSLIYLVNGTLTEWRKWTGCTVSCGGGTQYRTRKCLYHKKIPPEVEIFCNNASLREERQCNTKYCSGTTH